MFTFPMWKKGLYEGVRLSFSARKIEKGSLRWRWRLLAKGARCRR